MCLARREVDVRLPGKGNSNSHGARPVHVMITMISWIRTSRLSVKNSLSRPQDREQLINEHPIELRILSEEEEESAWERPFPAPAQPSAAQPR